VPASPVGRTAAECDACGKASGGKGTAVAGNHGDDTAVARLFEQILREQGCLDILANNAFSLRDDLLEQKGIWAKPLSKLGMLDVGVTSNYVAACRSKARCATQVRADRANLRFCGGDLHVPRDLRHLDGG
jgi:NAD(P)-dependent dehydrogenase (short-subunit alcohol dehydrogenase family)